MEGVAEAEISNSEDNSSSSPLKLELTSSKKTTKWNGTEEDSAAETQETANSSFDWFPLEGGMKDNNDNGCHTDEGAFGSEEVGTEEKEQSPNSPNSRSGDSGMGDSTETINLPPIRRKPMFKLMESEDEDEEDTFQEDIEPLRRKSQSLIEYPKECVSVTSNNNSKKENCRHMSTDSGTGLEIGPQSDLLMAAAPIPRNVTEVKQAMISVQPMSTKELLRTGDGEGGRRSVRFNSDSQVDFGQSGGGLCSTKRGRRLYSFKKPIVDRWKAVANRALRSDDPWAKYEIDQLPMHNCTRHRYSSIRKTWAKDTVQIKMQEEPFAHGAMRQCFRVKKLSTSGRYRNNDWKHAHNYVAKNYMDPNVPRETLFEDVKLQMDAKLWAEEYNRHKPPKKVDIFQITILEFIEKDGAPLYHLEHFIEGDYTKYNSNSGFVDETDRQTPQAFSHFTFERSGHQQIVVDVQGVGDLYTDPQIHTADGLGYGDGNLGTKGMALFFYSHKCNNICASMNLTPFDLAPTEMAARRKRMSSRPSMRMSVSDTVCRGHEESVVSPGRVRQPRDAIEFLRQRTLSERSSRSSGESSGNDEEDTDSPLGGLPSIIDTGELLMIEEDEYYPKQKESERRRGTLTHEENTEACAKIMSRKAAGERQNQAASGGYRDSGNGSSSVESSLTSLQEDCIMGTSGSYLRGSGGGPPASVMGGRRRRIRLESSICEDPNMVIITFCRSEADSGIHLATSPTGNQQLETIEEAPPPITMKEVGKSKRSGGVSSGLMLITNPTVDLMMTYSTGDVFDEPAAPVKQRPRYSSDCLDSICSNDGITNNGTTNNNNGSSSVTSQHADSTEQNERERYWENMRKHSRPAGLVNLDDSDNDDCDGDDAGHDLDTEFDDGHMEDEQREHSEGMKDHQDRDIQPSVLGQVHLDLARYHELGRFIEVPEDQDSGQGEECPTEGNAEKLREQYDRIAAWFHLETAAKCRVMEAMLTAARTYLGLGHDLLAGFKVTSDNDEDRAENEDQGLDWMEQAAECGDRGAQIHLAEAFRTGLCLGSEREKSYAEAVRWYERAIDAERNKNTTEGDDPGSFPNKQQQSLLMMNDETPMYMLMATMADLLRSGGFGLTKNPERAGELYNEAAELAMEAGKGKLSTKYFMVSEECYGEMTEE